MEQIIYHYCSAEVFRSIIRNKKIWLSDLLKSNDCEEDKVLFEQYYSYLMYKQIPVNQDAIRSLFADAQSKTTIYGISFTEEKDSLKLWEKYSQLDGFCIGFSIEEIKTLTSKIHSLEGYETHFGKVSYVSGYEELISFFEKMLSIRQNEIDQDKVHTAYSCLKELSIASPMYKSVKWENEKEHRLVLRNFVERDFNPCLLN